MLFWSTGTSWTPQLLAIQSVAGSSPGHSGQSSPDLQFPAELSRLGSATTPEACSAADEVATTPGIELKLGRLLAFDETPGAGDGPESWG